VISVALFFFVLPACYGHVPDIQSTGHALAITEKEDLVERPRRIQV